MICKRLAKMRLDVATTEANDNFSSLFVMSVMAVTVAQLIAKRILARFYMNLSAFLKFITFRQQAK